MSYSSITTLTIALALAAQVSAQSTISGWRETTPLPEPAYFARAVSYNGHILAFKYWTSPVRVWVGDIGPNGDIVSWRETLAPPLPVGAVNFKAIARVGDYVVIPDSGQSYIADLAADGSIVAWRTAPGTANPAADQRAIAVDGNRIFTVAGSLPYTTYANVEVATLDNAGTLSAWTSLNSLPVALLDCMATVMDGYLYVFGGSSNDPLDLTIASQVQRAQLLADGTIGPWTNRGAMREARPHSGYLRYGDTLHILPAGVHSYSTLSVESVRQSDLGDTSKHVYSQAFPQMQIQSGITEGGGFGYVIGGVSAAYAGNWTNKVWVVALTDPAPTANVSPSSLTFPNQAPGTSSAALAVTLTNTGTVALTVASITVTSEFSQINSCGATLSPGASCTVQVTFSPLNSGNKSGTLTIQDNSPQSPRTIQLSGMGMTQAEVQVQSSTNAGVAGAAITYRNSSGLWVPFGTTGSDGSARAYAPQGSVTFRATLAGVTLERTQDTATPVRFTTTTVRLQYSGAIDLFDPSAGWRAFTKPAMELFPGNYSFRFAGIATLSLPVSSTELRKSIALERLTDSTGQPAATGQGQFYQTSWKSCQPEEAAAPGIILCALDGLVSSASFSMTYKGGRQDKSQSIATDSDVVFQTRRVTARLIDSSGTSLDTGTAQYYAGSWRPIGSTTSGSVQIELLPISYSFSMDYAGTRQQRAQNIATDPVVVFQTRSILMQLRDSAGNLLSGGVGTYYGGSWLAFGPLSNGQATKELLAGNIPFAVEYAGGRQQKQQDTTLDPVVVFQTVKVSLLLRDSAGNPLDPGTAAYYGSAWTAFGSTTGGRTEKELLPVSYSFRMEYAATQQQKSQDVAANPVIVFQTGRVHSLSGTCTGYYASGWHTITGDVELLPGPIPFRFSDGTANTTSTIVTATMNNIH